MLFRESVKIGIVGLGFVGSAIRDALNDMFCELVLVDPPKGLPNTFKDLNKCEGVFICVPSPSRDDGSCDTSILESVLEELKDFDGVIISKTTAPPSVYQSLSNRYKNLVHSPEFLTAANASRDYVEGKFAIIGGSVPAWTREAERLIRMSQPNLAEIKYCTPAEASMAKYTINCFLATKVVFMNEIYELCNATGQDYQKIADLVRLDPRIGSSHLKVPGPDGNLGFGGMCFPKDTSALLKYADWYDISLNVIDAAIKKNIMLRLTEPK